MNVTLSGCVQPPGFETVAMFVAGSIETTRHSVGAALNVTRSGGAPDRQSFSAIGVNGAAWSAIGAITGRMSTVNVAGSFDVQPSTSVTWKVIVSEASVCGGAVTVMTFTSSRVTSNVSLPVQLQVNGGVPPLTYVSASIGANGVPSCTHWSGMPNSTIGTTRSSVSSAQTVRKLGENSPSPR